MGQREVGLDAGEARRRLDLQPLAALAEGWPWRSPPRKWDIPPPPRRGPEAADRIGAAPDEQLGRVAGQPEATCRLRLQG